MQVELTVVHLDNTEFERGESVNDHRKNAWLLCIFEMPSQSKEENRERSFEELSEKLQNDIFNKKNRERESKIAIEKILDNFDNSVHLDESLDNHDDQSHILLGVLLNNNGNVVTQIDS